MTTTDPRPTDFAHEIAARLEAERVVLLTPAESEHLRETAALVSEDDTGLSGPIRVLDLDGRILVEERSQLPEILLRELPSLDDARRFVKARLDAYERMWDG